MKFLYSDGLRLLVTLPLRQHLLELEWEDSGPKLRKYHPVPKWDLQPDISFGSDPRSVLVLPINPVFARGVFVGLRRGDLFEFERVHWPFAGHYPRSAVEFRGTFLLATVEEGLMNGFLPHSVAKFDPQSRSFELSYTERMHRLRTEGSYTPLCPELTRLPADVVLSSSLLRNYSYMSADFEAPVLQLGDKVDAFGSGPDDRIVTLKNKGNGWMMNYLSRSGESQQIGHWSRVPWAIAKAITITASNHIVVFDGRSKLFWQPLGSENWREEEF